MLPWPTSTTYLQRSRPAVEQPCFHRDYRAVSQRLRSAALSPLMPLLLTACQDPQTKRLTQLNEKWSESGAVIHKFRISHRGLDRKPSRSPNSSSPSATSPPSPQSPLYRQPSPSQHLELARALLDAMNTGSVGHRMSAFGPFIREVPQRIGHNAALDAAAACLVNAHYSLVHNKNAGEIANPQLYLRAVQTLQTCLEDPHQGMSPNTLCASVLLGLVEVSALFKISLILAN